LLLYFSGRAESRHSPHGAPRTGYRTELPFRISLNSRSLHSSWLRYVGIFQKVKSSMRSVLSCTKKRLTCAHPSRPCHCVQACRDRGQRHLGGKAVHPIGSPGRSPLGAPVQAIHKNAPLKKRLSPPVRPGSLILPKQLDPIKAHWVSLITMRSLNILTPRFEGVKQMPAKLGILNINRP